MDTDQTLTHTDMIGLLKPALDAKRKNTEADSNYEAVKNIIKAFLQAHRDTAELWDGENRIRAVLQPRTGSSEMDWRSLAHDKPELALWALEMGLATLNAAAFVAMGKNDQFAEALDLARYVSPGPGSEALQIVEVP